MNHKEEAKILVEKFNQLQIDDKDFHSKLFSIKCALICEDEILKLIGDECFTEYKDHQKIKQEIKKL